MYVHKCVLAGVLSFIFFVSQVLAVKSSNNSDEQSSYSGVMGISSRDLRILDDALASQSGRGQKIPPKANQANSKPNSTTNLETKTGRYKGSVPVKSFYSVNHERGKFQSNKKPAENPDGTKHAKPKKNRGKGSDAQRVENMIISALDMYEIKKDDRKEQEIEDQRSKREELKPKALKEKALHFPSLSEANQREKGLNRSTFLNNYMDEQKKQGLDFFPEGKDFLQLTAKMKQESSKDISLYSAALLIASLVDQDASRNHGLFIQDKFSRKNAINVNHFPEPCVMVYPGKKSKKGRKSGAVNVYYLNGKKEAYNQDEVSTLAIDTVSSLPTKPLGNEIRNTQLQQVVGNKYDYKLVNPELLKYIRPTLSALKTFKREEQKAQERLAESVKNPDDQARIKALHAKLSTIPST